MRPKPKRKRRIPTYIRRLSQASRYKILNEKFAIQQRHARAITEITRAVSQLADLDTTLRRVLASLQTVMRIDGFWVGLYEPGTKLMVYPIMYDSEQFFEEEAQALNPNTLTAKAMYERRAIFINRSAEEMQQINISKQLMIGDHNRVSASIMFAPLLLGDEAIGVISIHTYTIGSYTQAMADMLLEVGYPIATAVNNARLYDKQEKRINQLDSLYRMGQAVSELRDLSGTLQNIFDELRQILALDVFYVLTYDPDTQMLHYLMLYDDGQFWDEAPVHIANTGFGYEILIEKNRVLINRTAEEITAYENDFTDRIGNRNRVSASIMAAPIKIGEDLLGMISAQSYTLNAFDEESLSLLNNASLQIGVALHNARLYETLRHELQERQLAEAEVRKLNTELEARVAHRTAELEASNKELESFTYSISHDLRAPLRVMNGYASVLLQDYTDNLDEEAQHFLTRIEHNSKRMWQLVEDLLAFSRMGRKELHRRTLNLNLVLDAVLENMRRDGQLGQAVIDVQDLPSCFADESLLRQVFYNLIDNALKYASQRAQAEIKIYAETNETSAWVFIKDNGIGFDMHYVDKLFTVFQRLHTDETYEGTGVGLALVHRIITRLGGNVRAEGIPGMGATFSFSLPLSS